MRKLIIVAAATMTFAACGSDTGGGSAASSPSITTPAATEAPTTTTVAVVSMEDARQQYVVISDEFNNVVLPMGDIVSTEECPAYLTASQTFVDDLKGASWPATVKDQLNELVAAGEEELVLRDDACDADEAELDTVITRITDAVVAWRLAIGAPTD